MYLQKKSTHASLVADTNLPATAAFLDRPWDDKEKLKKNAICCGALLGAEKSSLPLGEGNAAFFWASFSAYFKLLTEANLPGTAALLDPSLDGLDWRSGFSCALLGGKKSSLPLGEGNAAFSGASFCASWVLKSQLLKIAHTSESAWHGGTFGPFLGGLGLPLGLLMCAFGGQKIETASGGRKRTFVEELAVKEHLLC